MLSNEGNSLLTDVAQMDSDHIDHFVQHTPHRSAILEAYQRCYDPQLLENVRKTFWGTEEDTSYLRVLAEVHRQKAIHLSRNYTSPENIQELNTLTDTQMDLTKWENIYNSYTPSQLVNMAVYSQVQTDTLNNDISRILKAFTYLKTNDSSYLIDAYNLNNRGHGLSLEKQVTKIGYVLKKLDPVFAGLLCGFINKITTNDESTSGDYGTTLNNGRWINILSDSNPSGVSTVAHEFGHAIHYALGIHCQSSIDNRDATAEFQKDHSIEVTPMKPFEQFQMNIQSLWNQYINNEIQELRTYQQKNFNEFFACAFEYWIVDETPEEYTRLYQKHLA